MKTQPLTAGVLQLRLGRVACYLVRLDDAGEAVLVDSGIPAHGAQLREQLPRLDPPVTRLRAILLTHSHLDHAGGAAALSRAHGCPVLVHRQDLAAVQGHERLSPLRRPLDPLLGPLFATLDRRVFGFRPPADLRPLDDGWQGHGLRLLHCPGHTPGHSAYQHRQSGVVLCGDAAISRGSQGLRPPSRLFTVDRAAAARSLERLAALQAPLYAFGHGPPLAHGAEALGRLARQL